MSDGMLDPVHAPEDAFHVDMAGRSAGEPHRAELPSLAPATTVAPAAVGTVEAPVLTPVAFPPPEPSDGFNLVASAPEVAVDPALATLQRIEQKLAAPAPVATEASKSPFDLIAEKILNDPNASDEAKILAAATLQQNDRMGKMEAQLQSREQAEQSARAAAAEAQIVAEIDAVRKTYNFSDAEVAQIEAAWDKAAQGDPRFAVLTFGEAARRLYGDQAIEARRIGARAMTTPSVIPTAPVTQHPAGHLVSDASTGATGTRGGWTPPTRDKGPTLNDAREAAIARLENR